MWCPVLSYEHDEAVTLRVVDTPWYWVAAVWFSCWLSSKPFVSRFGFALLQWADRREEAASTERFSVPLSAEVAASVEAALGYRIQDAEDVSHP